MAKSSLYHYGYKSFLCPCGSQRTFVDCCEPYLQGSAIAPTAEALMRSRYTAYCKGHVDHLIATHHPSQRSLGDRASLSKSIQNTTWLGLTVISTEHGQPEDETGVVEFVAIYQAGSVGQLHERSRFKKQKGRWLYVDGDQLSPLEPK
ncbi:MAG: YchJ family metal-binding protein, partial [Cyanobacteria bacterium J06559_3]